MAVKIRLKRMGKIRAPFYRVVVMDSRTKRDGRAIEEIGKYHPTEEPSLIDISSERAQYWLSQGAQPSDAVTALLKVTGDWQRFTGAGGAEGTLQVSSPKKSKRELYDAAVAAAGKSLDGKGSPSPRKRAAASSGASPAASSAAAKAGRATATEVTSEPKSEAKSEAKAEDPEVIAAEEDAAERKVVAEAEQARSVTSETSEA